MGRAIDMERSLDELKIRVEKLQEALDTILDSATIRKNVDILEEVKDEKEETNNERDGKSAKSSNSGKSKSKKSSN